MINSIRQEMVVQEGGKIEILSPELPIGTKVEVIVLIEPVESETEHWLRSSADDEQLAIARQEFANKQWVELNNSDNLLVSRQAGILNGKLGEAFFEPLPEEELNTWE